jgi:hypothetical protein
VTTSASGLLSMRSTSNIRWGTGVSNRPHEDAVDTLVPCEASTLVITALLSVRNQWYASS